MIQKALAYLVSLAQVQQLKFDDREYTDKSLCPVKPPTQDELVVSTLTAIEDYFRDNPDSVDLAKAVVHIKNHTTVEVVSVVEGPWIQRHDYLTAKVEPKPFSFGRYLPIEDFLIALQTYFVQDEVTAKLMQVAGNLIDEASITLTDDGVTQKTQAKTGIARISDILLPNPVILAPYRTFLEVAQPASAFVFRLKKSDQGPTAALFEADGGNWQLESIKRARDYLRVALPAGTVILA